MLTFFKNLFGGNKDQKAQNEARVYAAQHKRNVKAQKRAYDHARTMEGKRVALDNIRRGK